MKKPLRAFLCAFALLFVLTACTSSYQQAAVPKDDISEASSVEHKPTEVSSVSQSSVPDDENTYEETSQKSSLEEDISESESVQEPVSEPEPEPEPDPEPEIEVPIITGDQFLTDVEMEVIDAINEERERLGLGILEYDERLRSAARIRSEELYENDMFAHQRPNGDPFETVLKEDIPVKYKSAGENLAMVEYNDPNGGYHEDAYFWYTEWENSPPHYENICRKNYNSIGVGIFYTYEGDMIVAYATTIFAKL